MAISLVDENDYLAKRVGFARSGGRVWLMVELVDGRAVGVPLSLFPTLLRATPSQRARWRRIGKGDGFQWPALDLDLSVRGIVQGRGEALPPRSRKSA
jgi:hypothetical protein